MHGFGIGIVVVGLVISFKIRRYFESKAKERKKKKAEFEAMRLEFWKQYRERGLEGRDWSLPFSSSNELLNLRRFLDQGVRIAINCGLISENQLGLPGALEDFKSKLNEQWYIQLQLEELSSCTATKEFDCILEQFRTELGEMPLSLVGTSEEKLADLRRKVQLTEAQDVVGVLRREMGRVGEDFCKARGSFEKVFAVNCIQPEKVGWTAEDQERKGLIEKFLSQINPSTPTGPVL